MVETVTVEKLMTKSGHETLKVNDYFVHSSYNPIREAEQLAKKYYKPHHAHIVFGYGCGYFIDALLKEFHFNERLLIVDPLFDDKIISIRKEHEHLNLFTSKAIENFEFFLNELAAEARVSFQVICLSNYDKVFTEIYKNLLIKVQSVQYNNRVNFYTLIRYAEDWQRNFIENLYNLSQDVSLKKLHQAYDCPVIIASGGPSLTKQLPLLKKIRHSIILLAAGSTVNSLLAAGIEPDYVVTIDGGAPNYAHFKNLHFDQARIIYSMQNHPGVRSVFSKKGYVTDTKGLYAFTNYLQNQVKADLPLLIGGGTVAHVAFTIAQYISSGPNALIGQDLAYTDNLTHAANNKFARPIDEAFIKKREAFQTEGYDGNPIWTSPVFYSMKMEFEGMIKMYPPKVPFYNCTEGGIKINGYKQMTFQQFVDEYVAETPVNIIEPSEDDVQQFDIDALLEREIKIYNRLLNDLKTGLSVLAKNRSNTTFDTNVIKKLDKIDAKTKVLFQELPIDSILSPITMDVLYSFLPKINETEQEAYTRVYNQTKTLYTKLIEAIQFSKSCTEEILAKHKQQGELS